MLFLGLYFVAILVTFHHLFVVKWRRTQYTFEPLGSALRTRSASSFLFMPAARDLVPALSWWLARSKKDASVLEEEDLKQPQCIKSFTMARNTCPLQSVLSCRYRLYSLTFWPLESFGFQSCKFITLCRIENDPFTTVNLVMEYLHCKWGSILWSFLCSTRTHF